jgi:hypothetical protein
MASAVSTPAAVAPKPALRKGHTAQGGCGHRRENEGEAERGGENRGEHCVEMVGGHGKSPVWIDGWMSARLLTPE